MARGKAAGNHGRGSHWIRDSKRLRIYERDRWKCVWCGCDVTSGANWAAEVRRVANGEVDEVRLATLDHVLPRTRGGSNHASNLVTACSECNEARGERSAIEFAADRAYRAITGMSREAVIARLHSECATLDRVIAAMGRELPPAGKKPKAA